MVVKFLILRFSSIGDIVLTTPVIRGIKTQVVNAEVHFATKKQFFSVISNNPYIDKIHLLDNNINELIEILQNEEFDYIIDLHHNIRTFFIKWRLRNTISFSFNKINVQKWLKVALKIDILPNVHIVDRYLKTCNLFDVENDNKGLDFFIDPTNEISIETLPSYLHNGYVAIVIGAKHATKQMTDEQIGTLCAFLKLPIVLLGGSEDIQKAENIIRIANYTSQDVVIFNGCGKYNIQQSASILKKAKVVITHDTGLMHIAAAFKKPIISIWGNTIPKFGMYPYVSNELSYYIENNRLWCRPCSKIGYKKCPLRHFKCMKKINMNDIIEKCHQWYFL